MNSQSNKITMNHFKLRFNAPSVINNQPLCNN